MLLYITKFNLSLNNKISVEQYYLVANSWIELDFYDLFVIQNSCSNYSEDTTSYQQSLSITCAFSATVELSERRCRIISITVQC